jgi:hypothetical protein
LRTLQRRVRQWRVLHGPDKEVFFPQEHPPGREAAYDFTNCDELGVTIAGVPFDHLLFELVSSFSGWRSPVVALSESFEALTLGVQEARWQLGGVVEMLRSDNLSESGSARRSAAAHAPPLVTDPKNDRAGTPQGGGEASKLGQTQSLQDKVMHAHGTAGQAPSETAHERLRIAIGSTVPSGFPSVRLSHCLALP